MKAIITRVKNVDRTWLVCFLIALLPLLMIIIASQIPSQAPLPGDMSIEFQNPIVETISLIYCIPAIIVLPLIGVAAIFSEFLAQVFICFYLPIIWSVILWSVACLVQLFLKKMR